MLLSLSVNILSAQSKDEIRDREPSRDTENTESKRKGSNHQPIGPCGNPTTKDQNEDRTRKEKSTNSNNRKKDDE